MESPMHTKQMWMMALVLTGLFAISACASSAPQAANTAADEAELKAGTTTWLAAYNAGEVEKIIPLYTEDAVVMPPHAPVAVGHAAIREFLTQDSAGARAAGLKLVE